QQLLDNLWRDVQKRPYTEVVIRSEMEDLRRGDIPMFVTTPATRDVADASGRMFPLPAGPTGLESVRSGIEALSNEGIKCQTDVVARVFDVFLANPESLKRVECQLPPSIPIETRTLVQRAAEIAERIMSTEVSFAGVDTWLTIDAPDGYHWQITPVGNDLY